MNIPIHNAIKNIHLLGEYFLTSHLRLYILSHIVPNCDFLNKNMYKVIH